MIDILRQYGFISVVLITLVGCGGSNETTNDDAVAPTEPVAPEIPTEPVAPEMPTSSLTPLFPETTDTPAPRNISISIFSANTAELNWTRPFFGDGIQTNEILRDGELIDTIPGGGNSYVDTNREPSRGYRYEIVAINRFGRASAVFLDTGLSGYPAALGLTLQNSEPDQFVDGATQFTYSCPAGGSWIVTPWEDERDTHNIEAINCSIGSITLSGGGQISNGFSDGLVTPSRILNIGTVSLSDARDNSRIDASRMFTNIDFDGRSGFASGDNVSVTRPDSAYQVREYQLAVTSGVPEDISLNSENVVGALAGSSRIRDRETILRGDNGFPVSGAIAILQLNTNNESYDIDASNGNPDTFTFTETSAGVTTAYEIAWSLSRNIGDLNYFSLDVGF